jgi:membrane protease YdiL (CAAX protease family)
MPEPVPPLPLRLWRRLPVIVRAIVVGQLILVVGGFPPGVFLLANLKLSPAVPWCLPATALWLWLFWRYLNGSGWPQSTAASRRRDLRAGSLSGRVWLWSLLAGGFGMAGVMSLAFLTARLAVLPADAFKSPVDLSACPPWTIISVLLSIAAVAGVVEEAAFRGYMLSQIERRHGWIVGIAITGLMFYLSHLSHLYATPAFLPFFLMYSLLQGLLVYWTRSILPSILVHAVSDFIVIPIQYGLTGDLLDPSARTCAVLFLVFSLASIPVFRRLVNVARDEGPNGSVVAESGNLAKERRQR